MATVIEVEPVKHRQKSGFGHLQLLHQSCQGIPLVKHRNPLTDQYTVQCVCGLTIRMPATGAAVRAFDLTAIDRQSRALPSGSYSSTADGLLTVVAKSAA
jgi:hypothetical protein